MSQILVTGEAKIRDIQGPVVANSGVITALDGAASQYVRGDGTLADFPTSSGGGSSVSYYLNSSVSQGTIGGVAYRELSKDPIIGGGTDIAISANGYVANYITDVNDPDVVLVPGGNFNCEFYFSVNNNTGNPTTYAELYKYDGTTFTLLGTSAGVPESINQGTTIAPYYFAIPVATAALSVTDRLAIRIYVNVDGRTVTLHTENGHLCQVVTTLSKGMVSLNNLTDQSQYLTTGTSGTNFAIVSSGDTHTFNLPVASATNTGKLSNTDWSTFNNKVPYTGATANVDLGIWDLDAASLFSNGLGVYIKKNVSGIANSVDYVALSSSTYKLNVAEASSATNAKIFNFDFSTLSDTTLSVNNTRTYTLPNLSGTLALLEGSQTFSGAKTFSALSNFDNVIRLKQNLASYSTSSGYTTLFSTEGGGQYGFGFYNGGGALNSLNFTTGSSNTYTFPASSGTIALTSNIPANIVTGTGTTNTLPKFTGTSTIGNSNITDSGSLITLGSNVTTTGSQFVQNGFYLTNSNGGATAGYTNMWGADDGIFFGLRNLTGGAKFVFQSATSYNYTFPAATGTLALTSNLSSYLPLAGGTLTGGLSGTTATFSGLGTFYQLTMTGATAGRIFYAQTGGVISQSGNLNWNETNGMLGVGTPNPSAVITAFSTNAATQFKAAGTAPAFTFSNTLTSASLACVFGLATAANHFVTGTAAGDMAIANQSATAGAIVFGTGTAEKMRMSPSGRLLVGTSVDSGALFQVAGAATFSSTITAATLSTIGTAVAGQNVQLNLNGVSGKAQRIEFQNSGVQQWLLGAGAASETSAFELFNSTGVIALSVNKSTNAATFSSSVTAKTSGDYRQATLGTSTGAALFITNTSYAGYGLLVGNSYSYGDAWLQVGRVDGTATAYNLLLQTSGGDVLVGRTSGGLSNTSGLTLLGSGAYQAECNSYIFYGNRTASDGLFMGIRRNNVDVGSITVTTSSTAFNTSSDYRLKEDLKEFKGLDLVSKIKTYNYKWKIDNSRSYGVIAHELSDVIPYAVTGEKDAVDENGNIKPQQVDYSKIVPVLVKSVQELSAQIEELKALINK